MPKAVPRGVPPRRHRGRPQGRGLRCVRSPRTSESPKGAYTAGSKIADREDGVSTGGKSTDSGRVRRAAEARKRIKLLEQEAEVMRRAVAYLSRDVNPK